MFIDLSNSFFLGAVNCTLNPSSKKHYFGHIGGYNSTIKFRLRREFSVCVSSSSKERRHKISTLNSATLREIMTDAPFEGKNTKPFNKPCFLFGDSIETPDNCLYDGEYKWLR